MGLVKSPPCRRPDPLRRRKKPSVSGQHRLSLLYQRRERRGRKGGTSIVVEIFFDQKTARGGENEEIKIRGTGTASLNSEPTKKKGGEGGLSGGGGMVPETFSHLSKGGMDSGEIHTSRGGRTRLKKVRSGGS